jgi:hypothetical protein
MTANKLQTLHLNRNQTIGELIDIIGSNSPDSMSLIICDSSIPFAIIPMAQLQNQIANKIVECWSRDPGIAIIQH